MAQAGAAGVAPVLSTPDTHIFEQESPAKDIWNNARPSDEQLYVTYEIERTVKEIRHGRWKRIALQFPDHMLVDAPFVYKALSRGLEQARRQKSREERRDVHSKGEVADIPAQPEGLQISEVKVNEPAERLFVLADTSYGACCVDEVAAERAEADVVVHYGRSCLSPTVRLPVIYIFTRPTFAIEPCIEAFSHLYRNPRQKVILMADIPYSDHLLEVARVLRDTGYSNIFVTSVVHDTSSLLPNRTVPQEVTENGVSLADWQLFHVSEPPQSLLLTLSSRVDAIHIYEPSPSEEKSPRSIEMSSKIALRRRYAILTSLTTVPIFGILINTLSVRNYMTILNHVKKIIASAGKKSYTFVVGKVNAAKIANFSEVGGWVVIGCWESSLFENKDFWKPIITPFELQLALKGDAERVWTGQWTSDFQAVLDSSTDDPSVLRLSETRAGSSKADELNDNSSEVTVNSEDSEGESEPPEFDLRTGRYVSNSRPMHSTKAEQKVIQREGSKEPTSTAITKRAKGDLATINGVKSPAAEFLNSKRTWQGLGSDFKPADDKYDTPLMAKGAAVVEEGRSGIARGYSSPAGREM